MIGNFLDGSLSKLQVLNLLELAKSVADEEPDYLKHRNRLPYTELTWYQCFCIEHALLSKGTLISLGTGLGKTYSAMGYISALLEKFNNKKILYVCMPISLDQTTEDFKNNTNFNIRTITGQENDIIKLKKNDINFNVLIVSYQALYNKQFANYLLELLPHVISCIVDEAHNISQDSLINSILEVLLKKVEYKVFLTATPITVSPTQVISLMNLLDEKMFPEGERFLRPYEIRDEETFELIDYKKLDDLSKMLYLRYVYWEREELGIKGTPRAYPLLVEPTDEEQLNCTLLNIPTILKGRKNSNQVEVLKALLLDLKKRGLIGLIYANRINNCKMIKEICNDINIKTEILNGETSREQKKQIQKDFHNFKYDVLITSLTTSLNLDCDFVIFWENTNLSQQVLGRCQRGFLPKDLLIYFILTNKTVELEQFDKNVWRRNKWLHEALGKDTEIFNQIHNKIQRYKI